MTTFNDHFTGILPDLIATPGAFDEAGVDPAFDSDSEELDRQFAENQIGR